MRRRELARGRGVRWQPDEPNGTGVLVAAGSSGRVDEHRARLFAAGGCTAEALRWFGGPGQNPGPFDIPVETFLDRAEALRRDCARIVLCGLSFGAEGVLAAASLARTGLVDGVIAFSPSPVVWAGYRPDGSVTSHWTHRGEPIPYVPFAEDAFPQDERPSFTPLYRESLRRNLTPAAQIAVERIPAVLLVAGGDDAVWPSVEHAERLRARRRRHGLGTALVTDPEAGHRALLPGEEPVRSSSSYRQGGHEVADRRLGERAWPLVVSMLAG